MAVTPSPSRSRKTSTHPRSTQPARRRAAQRELPPPALGHAGRTICEGTTEALKKLDAIEGEVGALARRTVADALAAAGGNAEQFTRIVRDVLAGAVAAAGDSGSELRLAIKGAARGTLLAVHDAGGSLARAASEIAKASIAEGHRVGADIGGVARSAFDGISQGLDEAGQSAAAIATQAARDALAVAADISNLAAHAVQQVLRGTAEGIEEVVKSHRAPQGAVRGGVPSTTLRVHG